MIIHCILPLWQARSKCDLTHSPTPQHPTASVSSPPPSSHPTATNDPHQVLIQLALALIMVVLTDYQRGHCLRRGLDEWDCD